MNLLVNDGLDDLTVSADKSDAILDDHERNHVLKQDSARNDPQSTPLDTIALGGRGRRGHNPSFQRRRLYFSDIKAIAVERFADNHDGITLDDILELADDPSYTPKQARDVLRNLKRNGRLFTFRRSKPQVYYLSRAEAVYSSQVKQSTITSSTHIHLTGVKALHRDKYATSLHSVTVPANKNNNVIAQRRNSASLEGESDLLAFLQENALYKCLLLFEGAPLCLHNIHTGFFLLTGEDTAESRECYDLLNSPGVTIGHINKAKMFKRPIEKYRQATFKLSPNGKVEVLIRCSKGPFPIVTDYDVTALIGFMHQVHYSLSLNLSDTVSSRYVPKVDLWRLTEADVSKDVPCDPISMHIEPRMQLKMFDTTLRLYVKLIGGDSVLRLEEMRSFNESFFDAVTSLREGVVS
jgi:hypothetical protein